MNSLSVIQSWFRSVSSIVGVAVGLPAFGMAVTGQITWAQAAPAIATGIIAFILPEKTPTNTQTNTVTNTVMQPVVSPVPIASPPVGGDAYAAQQAAANVAMSVRPATSVQLAPSTPATSVQSVQVQGPLPQAIEDVLAKRTDQPTLDVVNAVAEAAQLGLGVASVVGGPTGAVVAAAVPTAMELIAKMVADFEQARTNLETVKAALTTLPAVPAPRDMSSTIYTPSGT